MKRNIFRWLASRTRSRQVRATLGTAYGCWELYGLFGSMRLLGMRAIFASVIQIFSAVVLRRGERDEKK